MCASPRFDDCAWCRTEDGQHCARLRDARWLGLHGEPGPRAPRPAFVATGRREQHHRSHPHEGPPSRHHASPPESVVGCHSRPRAEAPTWAQEPSPESATGESPGRRRWWRRRPWLPRRARGTRGIHARGNAGIGAWRRPIGGGKAVDVPPTEGTESIVTGIRTRNSDAQANVSKCWNGGLSRVVVLPTSPGVQVSASSR